MVKDPTAVTSTLPWEPASLDFADPAPKVAVEFCDMARCKGRGTAGQEDLRLITYEPDRR